MNVKNSLNSTQLTFHFDIYWRHSTFFRKHEGKYHSIKYFLGIPFYNGYFLCER